MFLAAFTSRLGTTIGTTAFLFYLLDRFAGHPGYASLSQMADPIPSLLLFLVVGAIVDSLDRQRITVLADFIRVGLTLLMALGAALGSIPLIFVALILRSAVGKFFLPSETALLQGILDPEDYTLAQGLQQTQMSLFMLFGSALGALCYWTLGIEGTLAVNAVSFAVSGILMASCRIPEPVRMPNGATRLRELRIGRVLDDLRAGTRYIFRYRLLLTFMLGFLALGVAGSGFGVIYVYLLRYRLAPHDYQAMVALNGFTAGVGVMIGSVLAPMLARRMPLHRMIIWGFLAGGVLIIASGYAPNVPLFLTIDFVFALSVPFVNVPFGGWLPKIVAPEMMGRVSAWAGPLQSASGIVTLAVIAALFPRPLTATGLFVLVGGAVLVLGIYYLIALPPLVRQREMELSQAANLDMA